MYEELVLSQLPHKRSMLDMDTGGGERLRAMRERATTWPERVCATEAYPPNIGVAKANLSSIGVLVSPYTDYKHLPFADEEFDLIGNRHGQYSVHELRRLLTKNGIFITEQVGGDMCTGLNRLLLGVTPETSDWDLPHAAAELEASGFEIIERDEYRGADVFDDVGAIVWYLTMVPWQIPDFTVERYYERLRIIHKELQENGPIDVGSHHFLIVARKMGIPRG